MAAAGAAGRSTCPAAAGRCNTRPEADRKDPGPAGRSPAAADRHRSSRLGTLAVAAGARRRRRARARLMGAVGSRRGRRRSGLGLGR